MKILNFTNISHESLSNLFAGQSYNSFLEMFGGESGSFQTKWLTAISKKSEIHELNESAFKKLHLKFENEKNIQIKNCNSINELKSGNLHGKYDLISVDNPLGYYGYYEHFDFFYRCFACTSPLMVVHSLMLLHVPIINFLLKMKIGWMRAKDFMERL